jgi:predicted RNase H-like nuclease (RuvC/YqgF family)
MGPGELGVLIPIFALAIPIAAIVSNGMQKVAKLRLEEAKARAGNLDAGTPGEVQALREEVADLHRELEELNERVDFAERLLAQARDQGRLAAPPGAPNQ